MKFTKTLTAGAALCLLASSAFAYDADWKRGRVYYRQVCTSCHMAQVNKQFGPNEKTKADWAAYLTADKHAKGKDSVKQYYSKAYRASIKATNKAAEKFADTPDQAIAKFLDNDLSNEEAGLDVMVRAVMLTCHAAGRAMRERGRGAIVNVSSVASFIAPSMRWAWPDPSRRNTPVSSMLR